MSISHIKSLLGCALRRFLLRGKPRLCAFFVVFFLLSSNAHAFVFQDRISTYKSLAHYAMGHVYDLLGMTNRAVMEYEAARQFDETSYLVHLRLGTGYARLGMLTEAERELQLVNKYNAEDLQSHYLLALIYSSQKNYDKAAVEYERILTSFSEAEPKNIEIYGYLGQLYYSQRKYDQAIVQFEKILELEPKNADVMYLLGSLYLEVNKRVEAADILQKSVAIDPDHDGSLNTLAYMYAEDGAKLDEAERMALRALEINPNNGAYLDSLGWIYYQQGNYELSLKTLTLANSVMTDPVIYDHLGDVYLKLNKVDEALKYWNMSLELSPDQEAILKKVNSIKSPQAKRP